MQQAGFSGSIYSFHDGRDKVNPNKVEEKTRLRRWVLDRCKEVGIPVDETLSNGGFVEEPNDVMAFDFSEIWKCKKNFAFNLPPPGYDAEKQGPWAGTSLVPPIGLVGDSVTEPFWIAGVGLQRGWNGLMDACFLIDNLYNMSFSGELEPAETTSWNEHVQRLRNMIPVLYDCSHDGRMTKEGLQGEYADQGVIMTQLTRQMKDRGWHTVTFICFATFHLRICLCDLLIRMQRSLNGSCKPTPSPDTNTWPRRVRRSTKVPGSEAKRFWEGFALWSSFTGTRLRISFLFEFGGIWAELLRANVKMT